MVIKCKMCGGDLKIESGVTVYECEYCGSKQTIPTADNEKKMKLFDRANRLRLNCEFDKAATVYESIVNEFPEEAEGYWGNLLCTYGIEYVDDPVTGNKIPTCHRSSFTCFLEEEDFELVMENADAVSRGVYREQAKQIEEIRKGIIEVSGKEEPYDIFICYKETAEDGQRTIDSVLAQDVYDALTAKGYRVFFSRISLEDKLGTEYEPYIFAALNSAKVMLAFGTSYDYYNAVWVKNEWSRFLKLMALDKSKHLIPCYKDMDAYDIPNEFKALQAQDMGKVGAVQDLLRGIDKLTGKGEAAPNNESKTVIQQVVSGGSNVDALLKRGYDALEDDAFDEAKTFFNDALNSNAESADAYLGLFMAEIEAKDRSTAKSKYVSGDYTDNRYLKRAKQYATGILAEKLTDWDAKRNDRLQAEADAARRAKEETDRKIREIEENRRKNKEEIKKLQEQLRTGNFEMTAEEKEEQERLNIAAKSARKTVADAENQLSKSAEVQEADRLEGLISSKKAQLASLGLFKGKEKKELQEQINALNAACIEENKKVAEKQSEISQLKQQAENAEKQANEYTMQKQNQKKSLLQSQIKKLVIRTSIEGEVVSFGNYNGSTEWIVLEKEDNKVLIISKYAIGEREYNTECEVVTWETCSLRKWLNNDYLSSVFSSDEKTMISVTSVVNSHYSKYHTYGGNDTTDQVFLLSVDEANKYFSSDSERQATLTDGTPTWWWLRSTGSYGKIAADVHSDGSVDEAGSLVHSAHGAVRPALWIDLSNL